MSAAGLSYVSGGRPLGPVYVSTNGVELDGAGKTSFERARDRFHNGDWKAYLIEYTFITNSAGSTHLIGWQISGDIDFALGVCIYDEYVDARDALVWTTPVTICTSTWCLTENDSIYMLGTRNDDLRVR